MLEKVIDILASGESLPAKYQNHQLKGKYSGYFDCHVQPDWVLIYKIEKENILVIYDDMDIEPGKIKIRKKGSAGGHNGMKSIIQIIGTEEFPRIRVGIGRPIRKDDEINYVIGAIPEEDLKRLDEGIEKAQKAVEEILRNGVDSAMNKYN